MSRIIICSMVMSFLGGCALTDSAQTLNTESTEQDVISPNGQSTTGINPYVISPNGPSLSGVTLDGIASSGRAATGETITVASSGAPLGGSGIVGSSWTAHLSDGSEVALRIDAASQGTDDNRDVWSYLVSAWSGGVWQPLCVDDAGNPSFAESVTGTWNLEQGVSSGGSYKENARDFTLACRGSSVSKCVELGYKPWSGYGTQLASCVRALRADYCGDGTSYTVSGTEVNLFDNAGVEPTGVGWAIEAAWTQNGASCVTSAAATRFSQVAHRTPTCWGHGLKAKPSCGDEFSGAQRIVTELPPQ